MQRRSLGSPGRREGGFAPRRRRASGGGEGVDDRCAQERLWLWRPAVEIVRRDGAGVRPSFSAKRPTSAPASAPASATQGPPHSGTRFDRRARPRRGFLREPDAELRRNRPPPPPPATSCAAVAAARARRRPLARSEKSDFVFLMEEMDQYLDYIGGPAGALALTGVAAASAFYLASRPTPQRPLVALDRQSFPLPTDAMSVRLQGVKLLFYVVQLCPVLSPTNRNSFDRAKGDGFAFLTRRTSDNRGKQPFITQVGGDGAPPPPLGRGPWERASAHARVSSKQRGTRGRGGRSNVDNDSTMRMYKIGGRERHLLLSTYPMLYFDMKNV
ncbi:Uncharacterized protein GBIM_19128 [Gryllus bimaculatus]|nr:Uncharacterized protein GBIM_19128 [Gryllus bimaculatus]